MSLVPTSSANTPVLRPVQSIRIMISSRCNDSFAGQPLSASRARLQKAIEDARIFNQRVFEVWINERAGPAPATQNWWQWCLEQARNCDLLVVLYNGCSGSSLMPSQGVGICHAEFAEAMASAPDKVRLVRLEPAQAARSATDRAFADDIARYRLFSVAARTAAELDGAVQQSVLDGLRDLALKGARETRRGVAFFGPALQWSRLDYAGRREAMRTTMAAQLSQGAYRQGETTVVTQIDGENVLAVCDAIPAALSVAQAREMVGQPFLRDHLLAPRLKGIAGPVHFIACHKGVTEAQAIRQLGYPDVTVVSPPFGVYVADEVQKIQMIFLRDCKDATTTQSRVEEAREWLDRSQEAPELRRRAHERALIVQQIAAVQRRPVPRTVGAAVPSPAPAPSSRASRSPTRRGRP
jgi:hypothetical protein